VNDRVAVEKPHGGHEAILEFLLGRDADVAQHRSRDFGEETHHEIKPGAMLGSESKFEPVRGLAGEPKLWSLWRYARNACRGSA
jgi:hypothetical protein